MRQLSIHLACRAAAPVALLAGLLAAGGAQAQNAYITNGGSSNVTVIDTRTDRVVASPIAVGDFPFGVAVRPDGRRVYVVNRSADTVSVIDTATNTVVGNPISVEDSPISVAATPDGRRVYVVNSNVNTARAGTVSVIDTATNTLIDTDPATAGVNPIGVGRSAYGGAVTPDGSKVYVTNGADGTVSVIDTATNTVVGSPIPVGSFPNGVVVTPDGTRAYVANFGVPGLVWVIDAVNDTLVDADPSTDGIDPITAGDNANALAVTQDGKKLYVPNVNSATVSVIDTATNTLIDTDPDAAGVNPIPVGWNPEGLAVTPDGRKLYVANGGSNSVSVIDTATDKVIGDPIPVGLVPAAYGLFIGPPPPPFAGTPGAANCAGRSISAEARRYGGTSAAARALGYGTVAKMQTAIRVFCAG